jgi:hypothetical protein
MHTIRFNNLVTFTGTREDCVVNRKLSGDLLYTPEGVIDANSDWLFSWERDDPTAYARKAQKRGAIYQPINLSTHENL